MPNSKLPRADGLLLLVGTWIALYGWLVVTAGTWLAPEPSSRVLPGVPGSPPLEPHGYFARPPGQCLPASLVVTLSAALLAYHARRRAPSGGLMFRFGALNGLFLLLHYLAAPIGVSLGPAGPLVIAVPLFSALLGLQAWSVWRALRKPADDIQSVDEIQPADEPS